MKYYDVGRTQFSPYGAMWGRICTAMDVITAVW